MPSPVVTYRNGYLEEPYLQDEYLSGEVDYAYGFQAQMVIAEETEPYGFEAEMLVAAQEADFGLQALMVVGASAARGFQVYAETDVEDPTGFQALMGIVDETLARGMQAKADTLRHALHGVYLVDGYLTGPYLVEQMCAFPGLQAKGFISEQALFGFQATMVINAQRRIGQQARMIINATKATGFQARLVAVSRFGQQATMVIYNNTQLRFLCVFTSRGTAALLGNNWTASNQASGDFLPKNLNTDIEEQVFRSALSSVDLTCDTGVTQGVTIDTVAIRNHNLTTNALVQLQGSNSPTFATINVTINLVAERRNMYYIAPTFPTGVANQNRYWRFVIQDPTNPDGYVEIGAILFGNSDIFSLSENYENPIRMGFRHFVDRLPTEGFTSVSNDRSLKKTLSLSFTDLERVNGNFRAVDEMLEFARTSLKCLVIPAPIYPSRYAVFAKLAAMPQIEYRNVSDMDDVDGRQEYVTFSLDWDESL